jgi:hypothetical protein
LALQLAAAVFVIGSYILAERLQKRQLAERSRPNRVQVVAGHPKAG